MQQLQQQHLQLVQAALRHKRKVAEQVERAVEMEMSMSHLRKRLTNTADEEKQMAYQDALLLERAAAKRVAQIAQAARTSKMRRKRQVETDVRTPTRKDDEEVSCKSK